MSSIRPFGGACTARLSDIGSAGALRMSPRRSIETWTCWKSCANCDSRRIGWATCAEIMLKAISEPTVRSPSITALAPNSIRSAVVARLTYWIAFWPPAPVSVGAERRLHIVGELLLPFRAHHGLDSRRLQGVDPDDRLHEELLAQGAAVEFLLHLVGQGRPHQARDEDVDRDRRHHDPSQLRGIEAKHEHGDRDEGEDDIERTEQALPGQEGTDVLDLADARDRLASGARLEIRERQSQQMREQLLPELDVDPVRRMRQDVGPKILENDVEQADDGDAADQHEQGRVAFVGQDLVDHDLKEQRRDQREDLDEQRREQDIGQRLAGNATSRAGTI